VADDGVGNGVVAARAGLFSSEIKDVVGPTEPGTCMGTWAAYAGGGGGCDIMCCSWQVLVQPMVVATR
jgi:hypothetical protein